MTKRNKTHNNGKIYLLFIDFLLFTIAILNDNLSKKACYTYSFLSKFTFFGKPKNPIHRNKQEILKIISTSK